MSRGTVGRTVRLRWLARTVVSAMLVLAVFAALAALASAGPPWGSPPGSCPPPGHQYGAPEHQYAPPGIANGAPGHQYGAPGHQYGAPGLQYGCPPGLANTSRR